MKIALCIKQVPDTTDIKWTENNTIQREGVESVINPYDVYAIEAGLLIKQQKGAELTAFTMGPLQADVILRKAISLGVDKGILLSDRKFAGADTYATGTTLSAAIRKVLPDFDIVICGQFAVDGDTAQTGPAIANMLGIPQITYVKQIKEIDDFAITVIRELEDGEEIVKAQYPVMLCMLQAGFEPSRPKINGAIAAKKAEISVLSHEDLGLLPEKVGLKGSPTFVSRAFRPVQKHRNVPPTEASKESQVLFLYNKLVEFGAFDE